MLGSEKQLAGSHVWCVKSDGCSSNVNTALQTYNNLVQKKNLILRLELAQSFVNKPDRRSNNGYDGA